MEGREMAYNPTTWGSNDVITKDKLNKIEQGINTASKLSGTDIDTDKDWNGKAILNAGVIQNQTGNIGALSQFVDIPGNTVRKSVSYGSTILESTTQQVASVVVPTNYSSVPLSSNLRVVVEAPSWSGPYSALGWTVTVKRNGVAIGSASGSVGSNKTLTVDTTGGFAAGDTLTVEVSTPSNSAMSGCTTSFRSARSTNILAYKVFPTGGSW